MPAAYRDMGMIQTYALLNQNKNLICNHLLISSLLLQCSCGGVSEQPARVVLRCDGSICAPGGDREPVRGAAQDDAVQPQ